jgi:HEAT repeat protein
LVAAPKSFMLVAMTRFASSSALLLLLIALALAPVACKQSAPSSVPELTRQLSASSVKQRVEAADALAKLGSRAAPAVPRLIKALDDDEVRVKRSAAAALGLIGPAALPAFGALVKLEGMAQAEAALCAIAATVKPTAFVDAIWRHTSSQGDMAAKIAGIMAMRSMAARCPKTAAALHPLIKRRARQAIDQAARQDKLGAAVQRLVQPPVVRVELPGGDPARGIISVDGVQVGTLKQLRESKGPDWKLPRLVRLLEQKKAAWEQANPGKRFPGEVILRTELELEFRLVKKLIYSLGQAGYPNVRFSVAPKSEAT